MKRKKAKLTIFIFVLLISFMVFLFFLFKPYNYQKEYNASGFKVLEKYNKDTKYYIFLITKEQNIFPYQINYKYQNHRQLIDEIKVATIDDSLCILPISSQIDFTPLCVKDENVYVPSSNLNLFNFKYPKVNSENKEFNNIKINYLDNSTYLIYNYNGFNLINNKTQKIFTLFKKDIYNIDLFYQYQNYLIVPNYDEEYYFQKFYLINVQNNKLEEIEIANSISFNSVFLGDFKGKIYLLDKKEEKEYQINLKKKKVEEIPFQVVEKGKLVSKKYRQIINNNSKFTSEKNYVKYELNNNNLYKVIDNNLIKLTENKVDTIIKNKDDSVYYLVGESLYLYNDKKGEIKIMTNFEWNFNNTNMIFIF